MPSMKALCSSFQPKMGESSQSFWGKFPFPKILNFRDLEMSLKFPNDYKGILPLGMNFTVSFSTWSVTLTAHPSKAMFYRYLLVLSLLLCILPKGCSLLPWLQQPPWCSWCQVPGFHSQLAPWPSCEMPSENFSSLGRWTDNTNLTCLKLNSLHLNLLLTFLISANGVIMYVRKPSVFCG